MVVQRFRQVVCMGVFLLICPFAFAEETQPLHERSTPWIRSTNDEHVLVRLFVAKNSNADRYVGFLLPIDVGNGNAIWAKLERKVYLPSHISRELPDDVGKRFDYAAGQINTQTDRSKITAVFLDALLDREVHEWTDRNEKKESAGTAFIQVSTARQWHVQPYENSNLLVATVINPPSGQQNPRLGFYSFAEMERTLDPREWHVQLVGQLPPAGKQQASKPESAPNAAQHNLNAEFESEPPPSEEVYLLGTSPWETLWKSPNFKDAEVKIVSREGNSTEWLLVDKRKVRALALPQTRDEEQLERVKRAFDRGSKPKNIGNPVPIPAGLYDELRSNALFPLDPVDQPGGIDWTHFKRPKKQENGETAASPTPRLFLGLPVQWASMVHGQKKPHPSFVWQLTNRYQRRLFLSKENQDNWAGVAVYDGSDETLKPVTFGRDDPALEAASQHIQFHDDSDPYQENKYLPKGIQFWPPQNLSGQVSYAKDGIATEAGHELAARRDADPKCRYAEGGMAPEADSGWRFCLIIPHQTDKPAFYIQDREFTARHLMALWMGQKPQTLEDIRKDVDTLLGQSAEMGQPAADEAARVAKESAAKQQAGDKPAPKPQPPEKLDDTLDVAAIAKPFWIDAFYLSASVTGIPEFTGKNSAQLKLDAERECLLAGRTFIARLEKWKILADNFRDDKTVPPSERTARKQWREWRCAFEFAELVSYFEQRAIGWIEVREGSKEANSVDFMAQARDVFHKAFLHRIDGYEAPEGERFTSPEQEKTREEVANLRLSDAVKRYDAMRRELTDRHVKVPSLAANPLDWPLVGISIDEIQHLMRRWQVQNFPGKLPWELSECGEFAVGPFGKWSVSFPTPEHWDATKAVANAPAGDTFNVAWTANKPRAWPLRCFHGHNGFQGFADHGPIQTPIYNLFGNVSEIVSDAEKDSFSVVGNNYREAVKDAIPTCKTACSPAIGFRLVLLPPDAPKGKKAQSPTKEFDPIALKEDRPDDPQHCAYPRLFGWESLSPGADLKDKRSTTPSLLWHREQRFVHEYLGPHEFWEIEHLRDILWGARGDLKYVRDQLPNDAFKVNTSKVLFEDVDAVPEAASQAKP